MGYDILAVSSGDVRAINSLLAQLSDKAKMINKRKYVEILRQENFFILVARELSTKRIVGMASIYFIRTLTALKAYIEDVVVDENHRGKGLGKRLVEGLIDLARSRGVDYIELTSSPKRAAANKMYLGLGFKQRETNVYRLVL